MPPESNAITAWKKVQTESKTTVGILTVDDPVYGYCRQALNAQDQEGFKIEVVRNVSPLSAAFHELVQRVQTEYFIYLDEDMLLYPYAVRRMEQALAAAPAEVAMICFHLFDQERGQNIHGVKIFRTAALRHARIRNVKTSDMDLLEQMLDVGFRWAVHPEVMGLHGALYSTDSVYNRYRSMYEKDICVWNSVGADIRKKAENFRQTGDPQELFALLGAAHGIIAAPLAPDTEKDFRQYQTHTLTVLKKLLLGPELPGQAYDESRGSRIFRNQPLRLEDIEWQAGGEVLDESRLREAVGGAQTASETLAVDMMIMGQLSEALLQKILETGKENPFTRLWLGLYLWRQGKFEEALLSFSQAQSRGVPAWRAAFYQALVIRDDSANLGQEKYAQARELIAAVLREQPELEAAKLYSLYLNGYHSGDGIDVLIEDFFCCNRPQDETFIDLSGGSSRPGVYVRRLLEKGWRAAGTDGSSDTQRRQCAFVHVEDGLSCLYSDETAAAFALRPALAGLKYDGSIENRLLLMQLLDNAGYVLWHGAPDYLLFREKNTLCAPDFWCQRRALPMRQVPLR